MTEGRRLQDQPWWVKVLVAAAALWLLGTAISILLAILALLGGWSL